MPYCLFWVKMCFNKRRNYTYKLILTLFIIVLLFPIYNPLDWECDLLINVKC